jgi:hypothetical protein
MVQAFLFPYISDLRVVNVWQIKRNNGKSSYCTMGGFGENENKELKHNC